MAELPHEEWPKCDHGNSIPCGGRITPTETEMNRLDPTLSALEYHRIMFLFEEACHNIH